MVKRIKQDSQLLEFLESNLKVTMISMVRYTEKVSECISRWRIPCRNGNHIKGLNDKAN